MSARRPSFRRVCRSAGRRAPLVACACLLTTRVSKLSLSEPTILINAAGDVEQASTATLPHMSCLVLHRRVFLRVAADRVLGGNGATPAIHAAIWRDLNCIRTLGSRRGLKWIGTGDERVVLHSGMLRAGAGCLQSRGPRRHRERPSKAFAVATFAALPSPPLIRQAPRFARERPRSSGKEGARKARAKAPVVCFRARSTRRRAARGGRAARGPERRSLPPALKPGRSAAIFLLLTSASPSVRTCTQARGSPGSRRGSRGPGPRAAGHDTTGRARSSSSGSLVGTL